MREKVVYNCPLSSLLGHLQHPTFQEHHARNLTVSRLNLCCLNAPYTLRWFCVTHSHWAVDLYSEYCHCEALLRSDCDGWYNKEMYAICPADRPRYFVSTALASEECLLTNCLLLAPALHIFLYYSNVPLDGKL